MASIIRKLLIPRTTIPIPKRYDLRSPEAEPERPFIPFSKLQERKLLETHLVSLLDVCNSLFQIKQVHAHVIRRGVEQCCYVLTKLIRTLAKIDVPVEPYPRMVFDRVGDRNPFLWTAIIRGYAMQGPFGESVRLYGLMRREGFSPVSFTFTALLKACSDRFEVDLGRQIHGQCVRIGGLCCDLYLGNTLIDMYVKCGWVECGRKVFDEMPLRDVISWTSLIFAYAKSGDMEDAVELFEKMPFKDMVAWTTVVTGLAQNGKPMEAIEFFRRMQNAGVQTDEVILSGVISACAQLGSSKHADWVRGVAERSGFGPADHVVVGSALIDMYSKCGSVEDAYDVFEKMREKNVFSYSSMILGFAMHGHANSALNLFEQMLRTNVKPNDVTFLGVLLACSYSGLVEQAKRYFDLMEKKYGIEPAVNHYSCMVDVLGRAGELEQALELIRNMPIKPNGGVWGALLGACRIHGNPDVAEVAANHLFELEPDGIGNYVLLSNIYASAGRWEDVLRVRKMIRSRSLKKNPSRSWIEGKDGAIHEFYAGDSTHPMSGSIKEAVMDLIEQLRLRCGYEPNLSCVPYDLNDEDKKRILMMHSEKLALAYGLLATDADSAIKIMKNLRICEDCHSFMCGASGVSGREIIIRDNNRFHHFRNGVCSCANFW
ncbi:PREDICTED: pentatricopeptide repeat-containing protein At5g44230 [Ipomoea nil]|uniref:pentatricopeptide repeat-containing protein At5g44230 n=1 Tax=Ipomoea nil TaxID=35883 RepID=UPI0009019AEE|nr:PREDICTED: pentatricopeptide repeat-containing protein At5g44230 [Ipomoea nil]